METFRCPTCLFVLTDPDARRCPSCHKRLRRGSRPIVLGDRTKFGAREPLHIDLVYTEHAEREKRNQAAEYLAASVAAPVVAPPTAEAVPVVGALHVVEPEPILHTTIYEPSQFDPELREVLDGLYRKARAETDDGKLGARGDESRE